MHMFCFQCQETSKDRGCTFGGHCGKSEETANYQDLLVYVLKGIGVVAHRLKGLGIALEREVGEFLFESLFMTITNTNFDVERFEDTIASALILKRRLLLELRRLGRDGGLPEPATWDELCRENYAHKAYRAGVRLTEEPDPRSLRETVTYSLKGISAYGHHAARLDAYDADVADFVVLALATIVTESNLELLFQLALDCGKYNLIAMARLDAANAEHYGTPEPRLVRIGVRERPGILVSGHDLVDLVELLEQTKDCGVDVYTNGEMIAAHYYPKLFAYEHLYANYGNAWWRQDVEFASFAGPILMTSNCIVPVQEAYADRIFTTGVAGYPKVPHLSARLPNGQRDFSSLIELAKRSSPPTPIDVGTMMGGFNHVPLWTQVDRILPLIEKGTLKRVIVMGGCDGRDSRRVYYKEVAEKLPRDTLILTAGCAKYVFCKLPLGDIEGIPRVLDAGQCNDCYSLIHFAAKLAARLGVRDLNELPISYEVCWYDQKAVAVFLSLLHLGVKKVRLGPTLPAFFSTGIVERLRRDYDLRTIGSSDADVASMMAGD